jgi:hypothetical protein
MMIATILFYPLLAVATWIFFLAIMDVKKARDAGRLTRAAKLIAYPILGIGYVLDFSFNVTSSVLFLELPREWLFTARVSRHIQNSGWRSTLARWFCENLLNPFDENHCG